MTPHTPAYEPRTDDELREHYEIEKQLANRLRSASREERLKLYGTVYNELFQRVPLHPQLVKKTDPSAFAWSIERQLRILAPFLRRDSTFLEIGAGDCALSRAVASSVRKVYAVDVSDEIMRGKPLPENLETRLSNGTDIPVPRGTIDVAYSNQVMEHLHPEDAFEQVCNIYAALARGGVYVCITPNRLSGPHDISKYFDDEIATGFHLKEYTFGELRDLFKRVGFSREIACIGGRGRYFRIPTLPVEIVESVLSRLPASVRRKLANRFVVSGMLGIRIIGRK
jgi:2-polyprenyl-3-methyl-5-hydroxy-6-metoxy-1,4-benzoquinol methylase